MIVSFIDFINNISLNPRNHRSLESFFINQLLLENKYIVQQDHITGYEDIILIQLSTPNFFGGVINPIKVKMIKQFVKSKAKIYFLANDPRIKPINFAEVYRKRLKNDEITEEDVISFGEKMANSIALFDGKDYPKFHRNKISWLYVPYFHYMFANLKKPIKPLYDDGFKKYDFCYYGDSRAKYRDTLLKKYMPGDEFNNVVVGYKKMKDHPSFHKKLKHAELMTFINQCKTNLVIGDEEHNDNVLTYRYFEIMKSKSVALIGDEYANPLHFIAPKANYVKNRKDVEYILNNYTIDLVTNQNKFINEYLEHFKKVTLTL